jgi:Fe/S biogenesis protein NfuA
METGILTVTETAIDQIKTVQQSKGLTDVALRLSVREDGAAYRHEFQFVPEDEKTPGDRVVELDGISIYVDEESFPRLEGTTVDFVDDISGSGFKIDNPNTPALLKNPIAARVHQLLEEKINPSIASHGGHVTLIDLQDGKVYLRFGGGCQGCGMVDVTLREGIVGLLQQEVPEITEVLDETDHASGTNPYYRPGDA